MLAIRFRIVLLFLLLLMLSGCGAMGAQIQGGKYLAAGDMKSAVPELEKALDGYEDLVGKDDWGTFPVRRQLITAYIAVGEMDKALYHLRVCATNVSRHFGPDSSEDLAVQSMYALCYIKMRNYKKALFYSNSYRQKNKKYDDASEEDNVIDLIFANASIGVGDYEAAYDMAQRKITADIPDKIRLHWIETMYNYYILQDEYKEALPYAKKGLQECMRIYGDKHVLVANNLSNVAQVYKRIGNHEEALSYYEQAMKLFAVNIGPKSSQVQLCRFQMIDCYNGLKQREQARNMLEQGLSETRGEANLASEHQRFILMAGVMAMGDSNYAEAVGYYRRILDAKKADENLRFVAAADIGTAYLLLKEYGKAKKAWEKALKFPPSVQNQSKRDQCNAYSGLAAVHIELGEEAKALSCLSNYLDLLISDMSDALFLMNETARADYIRYYQSEVLVVFGMLYEIRENPAARAMMMDVWLQRKGLLFEGSRSLNAAVANSDREDVAALLAELREVRSRITTRAYAVFSSQDEGAAADLAELYKRKEALEDSLAQQVRGASDLIKLLRVDAGKVGERLSPGSALVEIFGLYDVDMMDLEKELTARTVALIQTGSAPGEVSFVDLGRTEDLSELVRAHKGSVAKAGIMPSPALYEKVFKPLEQALGGAKKVYLSVGGVLEQLPFETMMRPDGTFLVEDYTFNYLLSGRNLLGRPARNNSGKVVVFADPEFDSPPAKEVATRAAVDNETRSLSFRRLPETAVEAERIARLFPAWETELHLGTDASEATMSGLHHPRFLHIATHGFFLEKETVETLVRLADADRASLWPGLAHGDDSVMDDPLLRSGLVLTGANISLRNPGMSDGIITAEKVASYDLEGTEMVVLSACETGLGKQLFSEGTYGLQRAFMRAGAQSLVISMWQVPDLETQELMVSMYEKIAQGRSRCDSLRQGMLKEMKVARKRYGRAYPFYWGSFVFYGRNN